MVAFIKSVTFDCAEPLVVARFWAEALGSNVDEDSTPERAWVEPAGWGGPTLWFQRSTGGTAARGPQHFDLRAVDGVDREVERLQSLGARVQTVHDEHVIMTDPEGSVFCVET